MHSSPMHNTWAQQEKRTCELRGSLPLHLLKPPLLSSSPLSPLSITQSADTAVHMS